MSIGKRIASAREKRKMTLEEVAQLCETTRQTIFKYENEIVTNLSAFSACSSLTSLSNDLPSKFSTKGL